MVSNPVQRKCNKKTAFAVFFESEELRKNLSATTKTLKNKLSATKKTSS